jgi:tetratricopeptide (TPR) repeat protein
MRRSKPSKTTLAALALAAGILAAPTGPVTIPAQAEEIASPLRGDPAAESAEREKLFAALAKAASAAEAATIASQIWQLWFRAPNAAAADLMLQAREHGAARDYAGAAALFDKLVQSEPDWAEAWNQRATLRYIMNDFEGSLADIDRVLALEPKHFGALSGQALILMHQGNMAAGQAALRKAVTIDPFLSERALLMGPKGQDI